MTLVHILVFSAAALLLGYILRGRGRGWVLLGLSLVAVFWLQPSTPIRYLDFWLATGSIAGTILIWAIVCQASHKVDHLTWLTGLAAAGIILLASVPRYFGSFCCLTATRPPDLLIVGGGVALLAFLTWTLLRFGQGKALSVALGLTIVLIVFIILKTEPLAQIASAGLRALAGQSTQSATGFDLRWLGFSYIAFRLLHVLRDHQNGKKTDLTLQEFITYVLFFPTLSAGPIDRAPRFVQDLRKSFRLSAADLIASGERLIPGIFKKFVLADALAVFALNQANADQTSSTIWLWVMLYAYALRIYFDFSGYTDIAIGLGKLFGIQLPENFEKPYLKSNLTTFWNSWHITLAQWFRAYFFNPVTRALRTRKKPVPMAVIIFIGQLGTMILIGLWHGVTWNFLIWGLWHGIGLFVHNRWAEALRIRLAGMLPAPRWQPWINAGGTLLTFHYVVLGWVWFALPTPDDSIQVFLKLFGI